MFILIGAIALAAFVAGCGFGAAITDAYRGRCALLDKLEADTRDFPVPDDITEPWH